MDQEGQPANIVSPGSQPETGWKFNPESEPPHNQNDHSENSGHHRVLDSVSWTASEFIAHDKSSSWYIMLGVTTAVLATLVFFLTHGDKISTATVIIVLMLFGVVGARRPRELSYEVDAQGIHIGEKLYSYAALRSFSVVQEEGVQSIWFIPLKRFMPAITIYFDPKDGRKIVDVLSKFLPMENRQLDPVDRLMHRLRF